MQLGGFMTALLQQAFNSAARLPDAEQDLLASWLLAELAAEDSFDRVIGDSAAKLTNLARQALAEDGRGETEALDPERL
jgi:hypothetical protein